MQYSISDDFEKIDPEIKSADTQILEMDIDAPATRVPCHDVTSPRCRGGDIGQSEASMGPADQSDAGNDCFPQVLGDGALGTEFWRIFSIFGF